MKQIQFYDLDNGNRPLPWRDIVSGGNMAHLLDVGHHSYEIREKPKPLRDGLYAVIGPDGVVHSGVWRRACGTWAIYERDGWRGRLRITDEIMTELGYKRFEVAR